MTARLRTRRRCLESAAERQYRRIQAPLRHHESPLRRALVVPQRNRAGGGGGSVGPFQTLGELHRSRARVAEWPVADPILRVLVLTQENATTKSHTRCASRRIGKTPAVPTGPGRGPLVRFGSKAVCHQNLTREREPMQLVRSAHALSSHPCAGSRAALRSCPPAWRGCPGRDQTGSCCPPFGPPICPAWP